MLVSEVDYELPSELIAQHPAPERTASRLLHLDAANGAIEDLAFADFPALVGPRDALVRNDTRVARAGGGPPPGALPGGRKCGPRARGRGPPPPPHPARPAPRGCRALPDGL